HQSTILLATSVGMNKKAIPAVMATAPNVRRANGARDADAERRSTTPMRIRKTAATDNLTGESVYLETVSRTCGATTPTRPTIPIKRPTAKASTIVLSRLV